MALAPSALAYNPSQLAGLFPGANMSGGSSTLYNPGMTFGAVGGASNPFVSSIPSGQRMSPASSPAASPAPAGTSNPYAPSGAAAALAGMSPGVNQNAAQAGATGTWSNTQVSDALKRTGISGGVASLLAQFLGSGAGFNPAVAQSLIAALQPQFAQGEANLMEQFGSEGLDMSSPAALGLSNYEAQTNLDVGALLSNMYEQSVQNYLNVLNPIGRQSEVQGGGGSVLGQISGLLSGLGGGGGISSLLGSLGHVSNSGGGGSGSLLGDAIMGTIAA